MAKKRRLRFRFTLATLLVGVTLLCVGLGYQTQQARRQREAVALICATGECTAVYDYEVGNGLSYPTEPELSSWLLEAFGKDFFYDVEVLWVGNDNPHRGSRTPKWDAASLRHVQDLPGLEQLVLCYTRLSDEAMAELSRSGSLRKIGFAGVEFTGPQRLAPVARMKQVNALTFHNCESLMTQDLMTLQALPIEQLTVRRLYNVPSDLGAQIAGFRQVQSLELYAVPLTDDDLEAISKLEHLRELNLRHCRPERQLSLADARLIAGMPKLQLVHLYEADCSDEVLRALAACPSLQTIKISWYPDGLTPKQESARQAHIRQLLPSKNVVFN